MKLQVALESKEEQKTLLTGTSTNLIGPEARQKHKKGWQRLFAENFPSVKR